MHVVVRGKSSLRLFKGKSAESEKWFERECHVERSYALYKMMYAQTSRSFMGRYDTFWRLCKSKSAEGEEWCKRARERERERGIERAGGRCREGEIEREG